MTGEWIDCPKCKGKDKHCDMCMGMGKIETPPDSYEVKPICFYVWLGIMILIILYYTLDMLKVI